MDVVYLAFLFGLLSPILADPPVVLDKEGFDGAVSQATGRKPHFVKFFAPW